VPEEDIVAEAEGVVGVAAEEVAVLVTPEDPWTSRLLMSHLAASFIFNQDINIIDESTKIKILKNT